MPNPPMTQKSPGLKQIAGFELLEKVGQGAMGAVFKARQLSLDRTVALKVLPRSIAKNAQFIERFMREARAAGRLNHPHIVQGIDVGLCNETQLYFFAMEFVDGPSLGQRLKESGAFSEAFVRKIARQIGEALDYANRNGLVHRDVKPDNILLNSQGLAKLADLGLAKQIAQDDASLTQAGVALGTPFYMAPEQIRGQLNLIDTRTDLYCLGSTLFHLVTGQPPYSGATNAVIMAAHLNDKIPLAHQVNPAVSEGFSRLLNSLMQKERTRRPLDPKVFLEMLGRVDAVVGTPQRAGRAIPGTTTSRELIRSATTGSRDRIRPATGFRESVSEGDVDRDVPAKSHTLIYVIASLLVVLLVGTGLLAWARSAKDEPAKVASATEEPRPPIAQPPPVPISAPPSKPTWNASEELENAKKASERNPSDLRGAFFLYERLLAEAQREKTEARWIERIAAARDEAKARYAEQVAMARADLAEKVREARASGEFDQALRAITDFPEDEAAERVRLKELADGLRKEAERRLNPLLQQAKAALQEGRLEEAEATLKTAESMTYRPLVAKVDVLRKRLVEARAALARKVVEEARKAADAGWAKLLAEFDATVLEKSDFEMLRVILKNARENRTLAPREADVALLNEVGAKLIEFSERDRKALASLAGQQVEWSIGGKRVSGRIKAVKDETIELSVTEGSAEMVRPVRLSALSAGDQARLRPALNPQGAVEQLAAALSRLKKGCEDYKAAGGFIEGAGASALAAHYQELIQEQQGTAGEVAADKAWREIAARAAPEKLTEKQAEDLRRAIQDFKEKYGTTKVAAARGQELVALTEKFATKATDAITADRIVLWNLSGDLYYYSRATLKAEVVLYLKGKAVAQIPEIKVNCNRGMNAACVSTEVLLRNDIVFDRMQVQVTNWTGAGGGFAEIQVFKGEENLALGRASKASDSDPEGGFALATDGEIPKQYYSSGWMPPRGKAWIEIDFTKPLGKLAPPDSSGRVRAAP